MVEEGVHPLQQGVFVAWMDEDAAFRCHNLGDAAYIRSQHGDAGGKGLHEDAGQVLKIREKQEEICEQERKNI